MSANECDCGREKHTSLGCGVPIPESVRRGGEVAPRRRAVRDFHAEQDRAAASGRTGADRMAMGLPCIPDRERGDMDMVKRLQDIVLCAIAAYLQRTDDSVAKDVAAAGERRFWGIIADVSERWSTGIHSWP